MTSPPTPAALPAQDLTARLASTRSVVAVALLFGVNGLVIGGYGGALPSIRERLDINSTQIALMLGVAGGAGILSMQIGGRLSDSIGARQVSLAGLPLIVAAATTFAFATTYPAALVGAVLLGLGNGTMDVAMNAVGVQVEAARRRPIMSFFHALWSVGGFVGAGSVVLMATLIARTGPAIVKPLMLLMAALALLALVVAYVITPHTAVIHHTVDGIRTKIPRVAWLLAIMGLGAVSGSMLTIRLLGDRLVARFGRRAVVRFGGACAAVGYLWVTLVSGLAPLIIGWAIVGFGVGMIAPQVYAVAGHMGGGRVLAVVVTFGYAAFLAGPAVMGFFVHSLGLHHAMVVPAILCLAIVGLAAVMPRRDADLATG
jgi:MFS family permease